MRVNSGAITVRLDEKQKKGLIVKANELIEARYKLTANEQKVILAMVSCIKMEDADFKVYRFQIKELAEFMGITHKDVYNDMMKITKKLITRVLDIFKPETNSYLTTAWLSSSEYFMGEGYIELCFDPKLKPYLLNLKDRFVKYKPEIIRQIRSGYSIRIYELLKQYQKLGQRSFELKELRNVLGIKDSEYKRYYDFKKYVLLIAQRDLKQNTDIYFGFREIRQAKTVTGVTFYILPNVKEKPDLELIEPEEKSQAELSLVKQVLFNRLVGYFLLSQAQAGEVLEKYPREYLEDQLKHIEADFETKDIRNKGAYAYNAIVQGYTYQKSLFDVEKAQAEEKKARNKEAAKKAQEKFAEELAQKTRQIEENLSENEKKDLLSEFEKKKIKPFNRKSWKEQGLESPLIRILWEKFLQEKYLKPEELLFREK